MNWWQQRSPKDWDCTEQYPTGTGLTTFPRYNRRALVEASVIVHTYNLSTQEAEAGELQIPGQPGLHRETLAQNISKQQKGSGREGPNAKPVHSIPWRGGGAHRSVCTGSVHLTGQPQPKLPLEQWGEKFIVTCFCSHSSFFLSSLCPDSSTLRRASASHSQLNFFPGYIKGAFIWSKGMFLMHLSVCLYVHVCVFMRVCAFMHVCFNRWGLAVFPRLVLNPWA
jgi:hypothetical protein